MEALAIVLAIAGMGGFGFAAFLMFWAGVFAVMVVLGLLIAAGEITVAAIEQRWPS